jgi:hypothetical protein
MGHFLTKLTSYFVGEPTPAAACPEDTDASRCKILEVGELPHATVNALNNARMDARHDHLNSLVRD